MAALVVFQAKTTLLEAPAARFAMVRLPMVRAAERSVRVSVKVSAEPPELLAATATLVMTPGGTDALTAMPLMPTSWMVAASVMVLVRTLSARLVSEARLNAWAFS